MSQIACALSFPVFIASSVASAARAGAHGGTTDYRNDVKTRIAQTEDPGMGVAECLLQAAPAHRLARSKTVLSAENDLLPESSMPEAHTELLDLPAEEPVAVEVARPPTLLKVSTHLESFGEESVLAPPATAALLQLSQAEVGDAVSDINFAGRQETSRIELLDLPVGSPLVPWLVQSDTDPQRGFPELPPRAVRDISLDFNSFGDEVEAVVASAGQALSAEELADMDAAPSLLQISQAEEIVSTPSADFDDWHPLALGGPAMLATLGLVLSLAVVLLKWSGVFLGHMIEKEGPEQEIWISTDRGS